VLALPNLSLLLVMACFWLVYLVVSTQLVGPLGRLLAERERRVREARDGHERARAALADAVARCERDLASAAAEGQKARAALRAAGETARRAQLQQRLARLDAELADVARVARAALRERASGLARDLASRLIGRSVA